MTFIFILVALCVGIVLGSLFQKWKTMEDIEEEPLPYVERPYKAKLVSHHVGHVGKHRKTGSFPISNVSVPPEPYMRGDEDRDLDDTMSFFAAVKAEVQPAAPGRETQVIVLPDPPPPVIKPSTTWAQEHVWHKPLSQLVDELEKQAYAPH